MDTNRDCVDNDSSDISIYFKGLKRHKLLTFEEELEYSRRIEKGDAEALTAMINANLRLVVKLAKPYVNRHMSLMDLVQEGNIGLIKAAKKYDYRKNVRFCTYAVWWIKQSIISTVYKSKIAYRRHVNAEASQSSFCLSLGVNHPSDITTMLDYLPDTLYSAPEETFINKCIKEDTHRFLDVLMEREKKILKDRFALDGGEIKTYRAIGERMGLSPEAIRQITNRALKKLRCEVAPMRRYFYR